MTGATSTPCRGGSRTHETTPTTPEPHRASALVSALNGLKKQAASRRHTSTSTPEQQAYEQGRYEAYRHARDLAEDILGRGARETT